MPNLCPHGLCGFVRNCRTEVDEELSFPVLRSSWAKRISQKVELPVRITPSSVLILTIDNLRLLRMKLQPTFPQPLRNSCPNFLSLAFRSAMHDGIIGIPLERQMRILPRHPHIERIMQKQIR